MTTFGRIVSDDQVEEAVMATLKKWLSTYMSEIERQVGVDSGFYQRPADSSFIPRTTFEKWPEDMLPAMVVLSPGVNDDPAREGRGLYRAKWDVGVIAVVESTDKDATRKYAYRMGAAVRGLLIQKQSLDGAFGGDVRGIDWLGHRNNELPDQDERTIWANRQLFTVEIGNVLTRGGGPSNPDPDPNAPPPDDAPVIPDADHVIDTVTVQKEPVNQ